MLTRSVFGTTEVGLFLVGWLLLYATPLSASPDAGNNADSASSGRRMFFGEIPLHATILGHSSPLPPEMARCVNCHPAVSRPPSVGSFAPPLDRSALIEPRRRRGGPPSQFSPATFCRLLRTGVDPAYILVSRQMPRYQLDDDQCLDLWRYLVEAGDGGRDEKH